MTMSKSEKVVKKWIKSALLKGDKQITTDEFKQFFGTRKTPLDNTEKHRKKVWIKTVMPLIKKEVVSNGFNPFNIKAEDVLVDLLTDSGTSKTAEMQQIILKKWSKIFPDIQTYSYARSPAREALNWGIKNIFGEQFAFHLVLQGRAAEFLLLNSLVSNEFLPKGSVILSNRPFDTTKGHICASGNKVISCNILTTPKTVIDSKNQFLGNIPIKKMKTEYEKNKENVKVILITVTDNGGGGQPISMKNIKEASEFAKENNLLVWIDACRVFENAFLIKMYEKKYKNKSVVEITREILSYSDMVTISFKKIYSHSGGGILINKKSKILSKNIEDIRNKIREETTVLYGNGFNSYCGITGIEMIEIISGLCLAMDPKIIAKRIAQVHKVSLSLKKSGFPVVGGAHALYIPADQILPNIKSENCPAEYLQAILLTANGTRGCGLGNIVYGNWKKKEEKWVLKEAPAMDSLRYAMPRLAYSDTALNEALMPLAIAYKNGYFKGLTGGLKPVNYNTNGFYHFGGKYEIRDKVEFLDIVKKIREIWFNI